MQQPPGYSVGDNYICKLNKSNNGLKQALRDWFLTFCSILVDLEFFPLVMEPCMFKYQKNSIYVFITLFVDDGLIASSTNKVGNELNRFFEMKFSRPAKFLGIQIIFKCNSIVLHQQDYINKLVKTFGVNKFSDTPSPKGHPVIEKDT